MNELALASFAAASDAHLIGEPRSARFAAFKARFDAPAARLAALGFRFLARSDPAYPPSSVRSTTRRRGFSPGRG